MTELYFCFFLSFFGTIFKLCPACAAGRFCGFVPPPSVTVPSNTAVIRFLSNMNNQQSGFRGYWTTDASVFPTLPPPPSYPWDNITIGKRGASGSVGLKGMEKVTNDIISI